MPETRNIATLTLACAVVTFAACSESANNNNNTTPGKSTEDEPAKAHTDPLADQLPGRSQPETVDATTSTESDLKQLDLDGLEDEVFDNDQKQSD